MFVLVSIGFACIVIGVIVGVMQSAAAGEQSKADAFIHSVLITGSNLHPHALCTYRFLRSCSNNIS